MVWATKYNNKNMIKTKNIDDATLIGELGVWTKQALTAGAENAFALAWQNPHNYKIIIDRVIVDVTTGGGTASAVLDVDVVDSATDTGDDIFDGIDISSSTTSINDSLNSTDNGTNGEGKVWKMSAKDGSSDYITAKILAAAASNLVGNVYIHYLKV